MASVSQELPIATPPKQESEWKYLRQPPMSG